MVQKVQEKIVHIPELRFFGIHVRYSIAKQEEGTNPPLSEIWERARTEGLWDSFQPYQEYVWMRR